MLERHEVIQRVLNLFDSPIYLEIGVNRGETFHKVSARRKVAVDPKFWFNAVDIDTEDYNEEYFQMSSDEYFSRLGWQVSVLM